MDTRAFLETEMNNLCRYTLKKCYTLDSLFIIWPHHCSNLVLGNYVDVSIVCRNTNVNLKFLKCLYIVYLFI